MTDLEIRHRLTLDGDRYVVTENFGEQPPITWIVSSRKEADLLIAARKALLLEMVADISPEAKEAVEDARHIDNLKAGRA